MPATAFKLLRTTACLAAGVAAMALIVVVAVGSAFLAATLALRTVAIRPRHTPRPVPRPRPAPRAETVA